MKNIYVTPSTEVVQGEILGVICSGSGVEPDQNDFGGTAKKNNWQSVGLWDDQFQSNGGASEGSNSSSHSIWND